MNLKNKLSKILSLFIALSTLQATPTHLLATSSTTYPIKLEATANPNKNCVDLSWKKLNNTTDYSYMIYQKHDNQTQNQSSYQSIPACSKVKVLQVYPEIPQLVSWVNTYGKGQITCNAIDIASFNANPSIAWNYDVLVFGFWDANNHKDLTLNSRNVVEEFIQEGHGVLFGHDTIQLNVHPNFGYLAKYINMTPTGGPQWVVPNADITPTTDIKITKKGLLTNYPYEIGDINTVLNVPATHALGQNPKGDIWMRLLENNQFYLTSWNNCAMIQTGHSKGAATLDEQKLLMNTLYYLAQKTTDTSWEDHMGQDVTAPTLPKLTNLTTNHNHQSINFNLTSNDLGDTYHYYIEGTQLNTGDKVTSNKATVYLESGLKGYSIVMNQEPLTIPDNTIETADNQYAIPINSELDLSKPIYIHVKALDNTNNASETLHVTYTYKPATYPKLSLATNTFTSQTTSQHIKLDYTNIGNGDARNITISFKPKNGLSLKDSTKNTILVDSLKKGTNNTLTYDIITKVSDKDENYPYEFVVTYENIEATKKYTETIQGTLYAPALEKIINLDYVLFSASPTTPFNINGWKANIDGSIYSGNTFNSYISELTVKNKIDAVSSIIIGGWKNSITQKQDFIKPIPMPELDEVLLEKAESQEPINGSLSYIQDQTIINKTIRTTGDVQINSTTFKGDCYIIADGNINYNVMDFSKSGTVYLYSRKGNITINGSSISLNGLLYAPKGQVTINAYTTSIDGAIYADCIQFNGSILNAKVNKRLNKFIVPLKF